MTDTHKTQLGKESEQRAYQLLSNNGLQLLTQNYRCHIGEIDLIMKDDNIIVFVEVRSKITDEHGDPLETITYSKQRKIIRTAMHFLQANNWLHSRYCRFDVVGILGDKTDWIKNAFTLDTYS